MNEQGCPSLGSREQKLAADLRLVAALLEAGQVSPEHMDLLKTELDRIEAAMAGGGA